MSGGWENVGGMYLSEDLVQFLASGNEWKIILQTIYSLKFDVTH